jgi:DNA-binding ferritin-like protein (Dps family)
MNVYSYFDKVNKRKELEKNLQGEYLKTYRAVFIYLVFRTMNHSLLEEIAQDILDLFLESQSRGEEIQSVIGEDYKKFCDEIISESALKMKSVSLLNFYIKHFFFSLALFVSGLGFLYLYYYYTGERMMPVFDVTLISVIIILGAFLGIIVITLLIGRSGYSFYKLLLTTPFALLLPLAIIILLSLLPIETDFLLFRINIVVTIALCWGIYYIAAEKEKNPAYNSFRLSAGKIIKACFSDKDQESRDHVVRKIPFFPLLKKTTVLSLYHIGGWLLATFISLTATVVDYDKVRPVFWLIILFNGLLYPLYTNGSLPEPSKMAVNKLIISLASALGLVITVLLLNYAIINF